jgi:hypothetical protein
MIKKYKYEGKDLYDNIYVPDLRKELIIGANGLYN